VGFVVDKVALGQVFSSEYFGFPCQNRSFHQLLHPHNHPEQAQEARSGRSAEWTQYGLQPPIFKKKIYIYIYIYILSNGIVDIRNNVLRIKNILRMAPILK
jgi:hypothetical protein